jgi:MATE family multidrug resistance protein
MDVPEGPRRFSAMSALVPVCDDTAKRGVYGTLDDPAEAESLLGQRNGDGEEVDVGTSGKREASLLFKYSVPLMFTYLLQYSFSLVTIFVVGHIGTDELGAVSNSEVRSRI